MQVLGGCKVQMLTFEADFLLSSASALDINSMERTPAFKISYWREFLDGMV